MMTGEKDRGVVGGVVVEIVGVGNRIEVLEVVGGSVEVFEVVDGVFGDSIDSVGAADAAQGASGVVEVLFDIVVVVEVVFVVMVGVAGDIVMESGTGAGRAHCSEPVLDVVSNSEVFWGLRCPGSGRLWCLGIKSK